MHDRRPTKLVRILTTLLLVPLVAVACDDAPTDEGDDGDGELDVQLEVTPDHVHAWQTEVTFTVTATDAQGEPVTDFETLSVERSPHDENTWSAIGVELAVAPGGDAYTGTYVFTSTGEFDVRVVGARPGDEAEVLHVMDGHLEVVRAHGDGGGYTVEFELVPGHIHAGDEGTLRFWVTDGDDPVTDLDADVHVDEAGSVDELHAADEAEPGVYEADHTFQDPGPAHAGLHFTGSGGEDAEVSFEVEISEAH